MGGSLFLLTFQQNYVMLFLCNEIFEHIFSKLKPEYIDIGESYRTIRYAMVWCMLYFKDHYFIVMIYSPSKQVKNLMIFHRHENTMVFCNGRVAYHAIHLMKDAKD